MTSGICFRSALIVSVALTACATTPPEPESRRQQSSGTSEAPPRPATPVLPGPKGVGDPCVSADGWVASAPSAPEGDGAEPVVVPSNGISEMAPTGIGFCLTGLPGYPSGYFTANCDTDKDCQSGSFCDGANPDCPKESDCRGECRKQCASDRDCVAPMTCSGGTAPRFFCYAKTDTRF